MVAGMCAMPVNTTYSALNTCPAANDASFIKKSLHSTFCNLSMIYHWQVPKTKIRKLTEAAAINTSCITLATIRLPGGTALDCPWFAPDVFLFWLVVIISRNIPHDSTNKIVKVAVPLMTAGQVQRH